MGRGLRRWQRRDLSFRRYAYIWADGVYLQARREPRAEGMLVLIGATPEGKKELLGFQVGVRESGQSWRELLVDLKARGLVIAPELATGEPRRGFPKAILLGSGGDSLTGDLGIVARLGFSGRDVADGLEQAPMLEPVHPLEGSELHRLGMAPGTTPADHLGLEQLDHRLGQGIVVAVTDAADRRLDAGFGKPHGLDRMSTPRAGRPVHSTQVARLSPG